MPQHYPHRADSLRVGDVFIPKRDAWNGARTVSRIVQTSRGLYIEVEERADPQCYEAFEEIRVVTRASGYPRS